MQFPISDQYRPWHYIARFNHNIAY